MIERNLMTPILESIKIAVNEEFGIARDVSETYNRLVQYTLKKLRPIEWTDFGDDIVKMFRSTIELFGVRYTYDVRAYFFFTEEEFDKKHEEGLFTSYADNDAETLHLRFGVVGGYIDAKSFNDTLQHELHHIFEFLNGRQLSYRTHGSNRDKSLNLYNRCVDIIQNAESSDDPISTIAMALYASFETEQDAHINGLDALISTCYSEREKRDVIIQSDAYERLSDIKQSIDDIESFSNEDIYSAFGITKHRALRILKDAQKSLTRKIGRVVVKHSVRMSESYTICYKGNQSKNQLLWLL